MFQIVLILICLLKIYNFVESSTNPTVIFESDGKTISFEGTKEINWNGDTFYAFRGIPYAKAPTGDLRFKDPQQLDSLPEYVDARYDGHECESIKATNASENCLILNIYTKNLKPIKALPVLVFIHSGGLYVGSSRSTLLGAQYLLEKDLVLVTFNYRLGALGFLNLGSKDVPGNAGFKDQVYALRWIQRFVEHFGGNQKDVTIMGYSAGGQSVSLHLVSPMSKNLFHKAIIMSGVVPPQTILPRNDQINLAIEQCRKLNCTIEENSSTSDDILNCLNRFKGGEIAATLRSLFYFGKDHPVYLWRPVIEKDFGQERFLTEDFYTLIKRGEFQRVPLLIGFTDGEFCTAAAEILENEELKKRFHEEFEILIPHILMFEDQTNKKELTEAISEYYAGSKHHTSWTFDQLCNMISDALIRFGSHRLGSMAAEYVKVYGYNFVYRGDYSHLEFRAERARVEHTDDLLYLFEMPSHPVKKSERDAKIVELYMDFVWNFTQHGEISKSSLTFPQGHFVINETITEKRGSNFADAFFWEQLFP